MKLYRARYWLGRQLTRPFGVDDCFEFKLNEHDDWKKVNDTRYARHDGWFIDYVEDELDVDNNLCYVVNIQYFEHPLNDKELKELKERLQLQCIRALEKKRDRAYKDLTAQIDFIKDSMKQ